MRRVVYTTCQVTYRRWPDRLRRVVYTTCQVTYRRRPDRLRRVVYTTCQVTYSRGPDGLRRVVYTTCQVTYCRRADGVRRVVRIALPFMHLQMHSLNIELVSIQKAGDWSSLCVLKYLTVDFPQKCQVENRVASFLFVVFFVYYFIGLGPRKLPILLANLLSCLIITTLYYLCNRYRRSLISVYK